MLKKQSHLLQKTVLLDSNLFLKKNKKHISLQKLYWRTLDAFMQVFMSHNITALLTYCTVIVKQGCNAHMYEYVRELSLIFTYHK